MVEFGQTVLCQGVPLPRSLKIPMRRAYVVLLDSVACLEQKPKMILGLGQALLGGLANPG